MRSPGFLIVVIGIIFSLPVIIIGLSLQTHDAFFHTQWYATFSQQLFNGELYPRWMMDVNGGLGSPAYFFYPPMMSYTASLFAFLKPIDPYGLYQLALAASFMIVVSGLTAYKWLKEFHDRRYALIGALIYMLIPFHYSIDLLIRSALAQVCAYVWLPLILLGAWRITIKGRFAPVGLSLSYGALILTHAPTTLLFSPFIPLYVLLLAKPKDRIRSLAITIGSMALGVGLSATYLMTAVTHQDYVNMSTMFVGVFEYSRHWLVTTDLFSFTYSNQVAWLILSFSGASLFAWWSSQRSTMQEDQPLETRRVRQLNRFAMGVILVSLFMITPLSMPLWEYIPLLPKVQFPHRFLVLLSLSLALLLPSLLIGKRTSEKSTPTSSLRTWGRISFGVAVVLTVIFTVKYGWGFYSVAKEHHNAPETHEQLAIAVDAFEYVPRWCKRAIERDYHEIQQLVREKYHAKQGFTIEEGDGYVEAERNGSRGYILNVKSDSGIVLDLHRFYYPGWESEDEIDSVILSPSPQEGLLRVQVPSGDHTMRLRMAATPTEHLGNIISLASFAILALIWLYMRKRE